MKVKHNLNPIYDKDSEILILGSFPSVKSREGEFYYHHPQNRFWKVLSAIYHEEIGDDINDKRNFLIKHHIALFDVIKECDIEGSSDSSIKNVKVNDIQNIINNSKITKIYTNGNLAHKLYKRYLQDTLNIEAISLPSTSPANAAYSLDKLVDKYLVINEKI